MIVTAPDKAEQTAETVSVFLAGSIENGAASPWQQSVASEIDKMGDVAIFNPRREHWDPSWSQSPNNPELREQITWELANLMNADIVFFYFEVGTMAPISLLELGLCLGEGKNVIVVCDPGFWREANVHVTTAFFKENVMRTRLFTDMAEGIAALKREVAVYSLSRVLTSERF